jgi:hypothetical protein
MHADDGGVDHLHGRVMRAPRGLFGNIGLMAAHSWSVSS